MTIRETTRFVDEPDDDFELSLDFAARKTYRRDSEARRMRPNNSGS